MCISGVRSVSTSALRANEVTVIESTKPGGAARPVAATGIPGLDDILAGGLTRRRLYLIEGMPGSGKTTLALQFLMEGVRLNEPVLYITLSETEEELREIDLLLVIGSRNSSNSNRLVEVARAGGVAAHLIDDESEIDFVLLERVVTRVVGRVSRHLVLHVRRRCEVLHQIAEVLLRLFCVLRREAETNGARRSERPRGEECEREGEE